MLNLDELDAMKKINRLTMALTVIYLVLLVWVVVMKMNTLSELSEIHKIYHIRSINFIPFFYNQENDLHLLEIIINILIFIPIGIYLKILDFNSIRIIVYGLFLSLTFEVTQFAFAVGSADITDLITNTAGTALGTTVYSMLAVIFKNKDGLNKALSFIALMCTTILIIACIMYKLLSASLA